MRKVITTAICSLGLLLMVGSGIASAEEVDGMDLYKANCKVCHAADSPSGEYTPMSLIKVQWERFFKRKYEKKHADLEFPDKGGKKVLEVITPEMLETIKAFSIDHAADSEHPMTCGK